jgi:hypothetical protein
MACCGYRRSAVGIRSGSGPSKRSAGDKVGFGGPLIELAKRRSFRREWHTAVALYGPILIVVAIAVWGGSSRGSIGFGLVIGVGATILLLLLGVTIFSSVVGIRAYRSYRKAKATKP